MLCLVSTPLFEVIERFRHEQSIMTSDSIDLSLRLRYIQAILITFMDMEKIGFIMIVKDLRRGFGQIFRHASFLVDTYYKHYDTTTRNHSSVQYAGEWSSVDEAHLTNRMVERFRDSISSFKEICLL